MTARRVTDVSLIYRPGEYVVVAHGAEATQHALRGEKFRRFYIDVPRTGPGPYIDELTAYAAQQPTRAQIIDGLALVYGAFSSNDLARIRPADRPAKGDEARVTEPPPNEVTIDAVLAQLSPTEFEVRDTSGRRWHVVPREPGPDSDGPRWYAATKLSGGTEQ